MTESKSSLRTPLGRARGLGSAKSGSGHWWMLRIASIPLIPLFFYFISQMNHLASKDRMEFIAWLKQPVPAIAALIFILCAFYHACLGMEEIIQDYLPVESQKITALLVNKMFFFALGAASVYAVLAISFGKI